MGPRERGGVISIETARSNLELLDAFTSFEYPNEIGPGVYDIHAPLIPTVSALAVRSPTKLVTTQQLTVAW